MTSPKSSTDELDELIQKVKRRNERNLNRAIIELAVIAGALIVLLMAIFFYLYVSKPKPEDSLPTARRQAGMISVVKVNEFSGDMYQLDSTLTNWVHHGRVILLNNLPK